MSGKVTIQSQWDGYLAEVKDYETGSSTTVGGSSEAEVLEAVLVWLGFDIYAKRGDA